MRIPTYPTHTDDLVNVDHREIIHALTRWSWVIGLCLLVAVFLALSYLQSAMPIYASKAVVQVEQAQKHVLKIEDIQKEDLRDAELLRTIENNFNSKDLFLRVVLANNLPSNPKFLPPSKSPAWWKIPFRAIGLMSSSKEAKPLEEKDYANRLAEMVKSKLRRGTRLIDVVVEHHDPELAQQLAQSMTKEFERWILEQRSGVSSTAYEFLQAEAERLKAKVQESELALQNYREKSGSVSVEDRQNIVVDKLKELNSKATTASAERLQMAADMEQAFQLVAQSKTEELLAIPSIASDNVVTELQKQLEHEEADFANLQQRYKPKHPKYIQAKSKIAEMKQALLNSAQAALERLKTKYQATTTTEENLKTALKQQEEISLQLSRQMMDYNNFAREAQSDRTMYQSVLDRLKETSVSKGLGEDIVRVVESPPLPAYPVRPKKMLTLAAAIVGGLGLGVLLTFFINSLDTSIRTVDQAEQFLNHPVVGSIPRNPKPLDSTSSLILAHEPESIMAESIRTLRASLSLLGTEDDRRTFLFTSAIPAEGKSFICSNYASSLAMQGLKTLLIDADLRRPTIYKYFDLQHHSTGVADYLVGRAKLPELAQATKVENLHVLTAGSRAPNPSELLAASTFANLIKDALASYDRIVIDTAPVNSVSDTLLIARHVQTTCLVVRFGKTPRKAIQRALQSIKQAGAKIGGVVLNYLPARSGFGYYYYYSSNDYYSRKS
ncbi:MAG: polysaccharide biosynthesis tyrosine autokinase [bacterium]